MSAQCRRIPSAADMFLDARSVDDGAEINCDICIVGAGAAGITIARELARRAIDVCVLESGGLEPDAATQRLYEGENVGDRYRLSGQTRGTVASSRLRYFGGTTNHWAGLCRPLDELDFEEREGVPDSGWPIRRGDLDRHYGRAAELCELATAHFDPQRWAKRAGAGLLGGDPRLGNAVFQLSAPTQFGTEYRAELKRARRVRVMLNANAVRLAASRGGGAIDRVRVATLQGRRFSVRAKRYVLATGAIENARLLLASNDVARGGIGNDHDLVGRYFTDHPGGTVATLAMPAGSRALDFYGVGTAFRIRAFGMITTSDELVRSEGLLRFGVLIDKLPRTLPPPPLREGIPKLLQTVEGHGEIALQALNMACEVVPNRDSRITLSGERDALGVPRVRLDWRLAEPVRRSVARSLEVLAQSLSRRGLGRVLSAPAAGERFWSEGIGGGSHHLGTTRMHRSPRRGVVDADCRVHGTSNLYVAGSSVFPTTGFANPTLTIVALALRLADTLGTERA